MPPSHRASNFTLSLLFIAYLSTQTFQIGKQLYCVPECSLCKPRIAKFLALTTNIPFMFTALAVALRKLRIECLRYITSWRVRLLRLARWILLSSNLQLSGKRSKSHYSPKLCISRPSIDIFLCAQLHKGISCTGWTVLFNSRQIYGRANKTHYSTNAIAASWNITNSGCFGSQW